jgi:phosphoribosylformylglycinamidine cyclo-ligase
MATQNEYQRSGVDYDVLDKVKREAISLAAATSAFPAISGAVEVSDSRGCSAYVAKIGDVTIATVLETLGTKSLLADQFLDLTGVSRYADIAQDTVGAIVNDIISVGALPLVVNAYYSTGDAAWYGDERKSMELLRGWRDACQKAGAAWGGGESPALPGLVASTAIELAGSAVGLVPTGREPVLGRGISVGDTIILLHSSGLHANGASLARRVAANQPNGLNETLPSGRSFGDALLDPTLLYVSFVRELLASSVVPKFMNAITGHGFLKIMRSPIDVRYVITALPPVPEVLQFMVDDRKMAPAEAYSTLNMGAGYVLVIPSENADEVLRIADATGHSALIAGHIDAGPRSLLIPELNLTYSAEDLQLQ